MADRDLSVVVFGASGITGRGVAAYLAERAGSNGFRWAVAGRDPQKIAGVLGDLGVSAPETIAADVEDPGSLEAMAARTSVVIDLVGPYTLYGQPVIEACISAGSHYLDLTGEMPFVRRMIEASQERAADAGVKIVNSAGFESLPADLCVQIAASAARERWSEELAAVDLDADTPPPDGPVKPAEIISGGTLQSLAEILGRDDAELTVDPAALITDQSQAQRVRNASPITLAPRFGPQGEVIGPMAPTPYINPAVIHRSAAILAEEEGREFTPFRYREGIVLPGSNTATMPLRYAAAATMAGVNVGIRSLVRSGPGMREKIAGFLRRRLPGSGWGPQGASMEDWSWRMAVNARTVAGHHVRVDLDADGHPGYLSTARMIGPPGAGSRRGRCAPR
jgi:short subunit dehydrogenase-like uncharacterized protein